MFRADPLEYFANELGVAGCHDDNADIRQIAQDKFAETILAHKLPVALLVFKQKIVVGSSLISLSDPVARDVEYFWLRYKHVCQFFDGRHRLFVN